MLALRPRIKVFLRNRLIGFTLSSLTSIVPEPSASKRSNASRISVFCSSVNSGREPVGRFFAPPPSAGRFI
jgi:hypothetical protein